MKTLRTALWISAGIVALVGLTAAPAAADQVFLDDVIVDGSLCVGVDCVNGESFGFDTIRLKENNLRIKFQDTSSSASFPTNDWQLTANDSTNGGQNKFSIDDIDGGRTPFTIEASAPSHSLYVDDGGRLGFGTSTPVVELHIVDGDTPTLRLEQDGSSGFAPQTWDVAGNETNFFIRDVTSGSTLPCRIRPGAPSSSIFIDTDGDVGLGTASPDRRLQVVGGNMKVGSSADATTRNIQIENSNQNWAFQNNNTTGTFSIRDVTAAATPFSMEAGAPANLFTLTAAGQVQVSGVVVHPDFVFEPFYDLESISEHAEYMFANKHLPAVGGGTYNKDGQPVVRLGERSQGVLEELEKAHIYINELHQRLEALEAKISVE